MATIYVLNGPNLNLLGTREPEIYGHATLADVERLCRATAERFALTIEFRQSNHEGELVDWIQEAARNGAAGIVINPAGYTHTSNIFTRESFRKHSYVAQVAKASLCGFGIDGYALAITGLAAMIAAKG